MLPCNASFAVLFTQSSIDSLMHCLQEYHHNTFFFAKIATQYITGGNVEIYKTVFAKSAMTQMRFELF